MVKKIKRARKKANAAIRKVAVSLNPQYFTGLPHSLMILPPPESSEKAYFIWQRQSDSGDFIVFFKTRWQDREYMSIFTERPGKYP